MSFAPQEAYVLYGNWNSDSRKHPAMHFLEEWVNYFDTKKLDAPYSDWFTEDAELIKADGSAYQGGEAAYMVLQQVYGLFDAYHHVPFYGTCHETEYGWELIGQAHVYATLPGSPGAGEEKVKDNTGKEWDMSVPGGFRFQYRKQSGAKHDGILFQRMELMSDSGPVLMALLKRGVIKPQELGL